MRLISFTAMCALALVAAPAATQPSAACKTVTDATRKQARTPSHEVIVQNAHPSAEVIYLADATYVKFPQGWKKTGPGYKDDPPDQGDTNLPRVYECRSLPDGAVDGVPARVFALHSVSDTTASDGTIWIAKATGLPIKSEGDATTNGRKAHVLATWSYDNIHAPVVK